MFTSHAVKSLPDLSLDLSEPIDWQAGLLRTLSYHLDVTAVATEPTSGLFAIGLSHTLFVGLSQRSLVHSRDVQWPYSLTWLSWSRMRAEDH